MSTEPAPPAPDATFRLGRYFYPLMAGVAYGIVLRLSFEHRLQALQIVSTVFLVVAPFCVGAVTVLVFARGARIGLRRAQGIAAFSMLLFLFGMFALAIEGLICLVLVAPVFLVASALGALVAALVNNHWNRPGTTLNCFILLPFLLGPLESMLPPADSMQLVSSTILIQATPEEVFDQLANVQRIKPEELGFSLMHVIGLPRPISADMRSTGVGAVRTSRWEKQVWFEEQITVWERPRAMHYAFHIPAGGIPREALDRHVEMGGEYFTVLDGGYDIRPTADGVELRLSTRFENRSRLQLYGNLWGKLVLADFHQSILGLMKQRAERAHAGHPNN